MTTENEVKESQDFDYKSLKKIEDFCNVLGIDPESANDISKIPEEFIKPLLAVYKIMVAYKAVKNGKKLNWNDSSKRKYAAWLEIEANEECPSGFAFANAFYYFTNSRSISGSRLSSEDPNQVMHIIKCLEEDYKTFFLED